LNSGELKKTQLEIIRCLGHAAEFRDNETGRHIIRISYFSRLLATQAGLTAQECDAICQASPMHDIGKIGIPDSVLLKPGPLTAEEWQVMKTHPTIGYQILSGQQSELLRLAASIAYTHHEKFNGEGYPRGLKGEDIPLEGRIVAIVDVFDALTSVRPYKQAWPIQKAFEFIRTQSGQHFDPQLVDIFLSHEQDVINIHDDWMDEEAV